MNIHGSAAASSFSSFPRTFLDLFEQVVRQHPDEVALVMGKSSLTYEELNCRADALAHGLSVQGIETHDTVAISLHRSSEAIVAFLAILKVGGVFLFIDPDYPQARQKFMLSDAQPKLVIARKGNHLDFPHVLFIDSSPENVGAPTEYPAGIPQTSFNEEAAYVVYTSGTTGTPKGAINTHLALANLAQQQIRFLGLGPGDRVLQFASYSFDASISEIVMTLASGATLVLAVAKDIIPGPSLVQVLVQNRISHITLPPSVLATLPRELFPDLRVIIVAGEPCPIELARYWAMNRRLVNGYGVSEAAVCSSMFEFDPGIDALPIGVPLPGIEFRVLDDDNLPVAIGDAGELYIGGIGVALGYLNRPELNTQRFVELMGTAGKKQRFYRSGDLVRPLVGGVYEYVGRRDNQVKIRGFRIELEEISLAIEKVEGVLECAVVIHHDGNGGKQLSAFVTLHPDYKMGERLRKGADIRADLSGTLPGYMIPACVSIVDDFPRTPTGKIDLADLATRPFNCDFDFASRDTLSEAEQSFVELVKSSIGIENVSLDRSFVDHGGDSLQAAQLSWILKEQYSVRIAESDILTEKSLRDLFEELESGSQMSLPELRSRDRDAPIAPIPSQSIFGVLEGMGVDSSSLNCCAAFVIEGKIDMPLLGRAYQKLFDFHEGLRLRFEITPEHFFIATHDEVRAELKTLDLRDDPEAMKKLSNLFLEAERICFSMQNDLLFRSWLVRMSDSQCLFILSAHHAVFDAWSLNILLQDWLAFAAEEVTGMSLVKPLPLQYLDFVMWFHEVHAARDEARERRYFEHVFSQPLPLFDLHGVKPRPEMKSRTGGNAFHTFSKERVAQIRFFCEKTRVTPFMLCTTALKTALFLRSGNPEILVGGPVSLRTHKDLERQIGLYGASFVLRTEFSETETFGSLLRRTQENLLESYRHLAHDILSIVQNYHIEMDFSRTPPFDVSIASHLIDIELCRPEVKQILGLDIRPYRFPLTTSFFDLEFTFHTFGGEIELESRFDAALYDFNQIKALNGLFDVILSETMSNPALTLLDLKSMT